MTARRILGFLAIVAGIVGIVRQAMREETEPDFMDYASRVLLVISGIALIAGASPARNHPADPDRFPPAGAEIEDLVRRGEVIPAIKLHRERFGSSLKEAKDAIDATRDRLRQSGEM